MILEGGVQLTTGRFRMLPRRLDGPPGTEVNDRREPRRALGRGGSAESLEESPRVDDDVVRQFAQERVERRLGGTGVVPLLQTQAELSRRGVEDGTETADVLGLGPPPRFPPADGDHGDADLLRELGLRHGDALTSRLESRVGARHS